MKPISRILAMLLFILLSHMSFSQTQVVDADNGIIASGSGATRKVSLGTNSLTGNTTIPFGGFNFNFSGTGKIGIRITNPDAPLHVYKNATDYLPAAIIEDDQNDGYTMLGLRGTNHQYQLGVGNTGETAFGLAGKFFIFDNDAAAVRLVLGTNGNFGIGNNNPTNRLTITAATAGATGLQFTQINSGSTAVAGNGKVLGLDGTGNVVLVTDAGAGTSWGLTGNNGTTPGTNFIGTADNQRLVFKTNNVEQATFLTNGNFGIGTNNPSTKLHVHGTFTMSHPTFTGTFTAENSANNTLRFVFSTVGEFMRIGPANIVDFGGQQLYAATRGAYFSNSQGLNALETASGNVVLNTVGGNTLIGTTSDNGNKLQVNGKIWTNQLMIPTSAGAGKVLVSDASGNATWQTASGANVWVYGGNAVAAASQIGNTSSQNLQIITNNLPRIHIDNDGNVGIGTINVNDAAYKLFVEGAIRTRKVRVDQLTWPDYVFHPSYNLRSLGEVEQFIQKNSHLPDVPSAAQVEKEGMDLGDNQAVLLRKIEELTLYIIEQNKRLEEQEKRIRQLEQKAKK